MANPAAYSINPQVHAFDDRTLIKNLEAQPATIESALRLCPAALFLSPVTLRPRFDVAQLIAFSPKHPLDAIEARVNLIHQELNLFPNLTVEDNLHLSGFHSIMVTLTVALTLTVLVGTT